MLELLHWGTDLALVYPQMVRTEAIHEIVVERHFGFQAFKALPQAVFDIGKKNGVHEPEIGFRYFVAIETEKRFNRYVNNVL